MFTSINHFTLSALLTSITTLFLGLFVLFRGGTKRKSYFIFTLYTLSISLWSFSVSRFDSTLIDDVLFWGRFLHMGAIFIPIFGLHFILHLLEINKQNKAIIISSYAVGAVFTYFNLFTLKLIKGITYRSNYSFPTPSTLYPAFFLFFVLCTGFCLMKLYFGFKDSKSEIANQRKYLFWGSLIGYTGGLNNFLITANIEIFPLHPFGVYAILIYVAISTYAIIRYRLMDISVAVTRTGVFVAVYTIVLGIPFAVAYFLRLWLIGIFDINWWAIPLSIMAVLATVGPFIYIYFERKAEDRLLKEQKRYQNTLRQASIGMTRIRSLRKLLELIAHIITKTVRISFAAVYLFHEADEEYVLQVCRVKNKMLASKLSAHCALIEWIKNNQAPLLYEEIKRKMIDEKNTDYRLVEEEMRLLGASVILPSLLENKLLGLLVLGNKLSGRMFTPEDLSVFQVLASQAALAIENAQFYEDAKEMQGQIAQAEKMATIGTMADGLSHQINNRFYALSLIAGDTIDTIKMTDASNCSTEIKDMLGQINHALERIQFNVLQGGEVVKGILKYTRKGDEGFEALTMDQVIDGTLAMVQYKVKLADFDLIREYPCDLAKIKGNLVQLEEVFFNFIDNAYDAIVERRSTLKEEGYRGKIIIRAQALDAVMRIEIQDNGMGVKEENAKKLFTPFFTTKVSSRRGTGLGLYVINKIITETHKGKIFIESQHTIGTKFIVELPIAAQT
ncbi:MAG: ATP-binding protein [Candidatus Omnitrophota bacterium]